MSVDVTFVIFGATGSLARTKLLPSLAKAVIDSGVAEHAVIGVGTTQRSDNDFEQIVRTSLEDAGVDPDCTERFLDGTIAYQAVGDPGSYIALGDRVRSIEEATDLSGNRVLYLAVPPSKLDTTIDGIAASGLDESPGWTRLVVEKPFGIDLETAETSTRAIHRVFNESDVYRIDHYLGKETVRNLLVFRFANALFEHTWNRSQIDSVEITVAESAGAQGRAAYYDESGAVRDMLQNHLTQLLTLVAMEPPVAMTADAIRTEKVKVLQSIRTVDPDDVVIGRYGKGMADGSPVDAYIDEPGVSDSSITPTFVAVRLFVDNWRWQGVPFYLRTGKMMSARTTQIIVRYARPPVCLVHAPEACPGHQNILMLRLQPEERFELLIDVKEPGDTLEVIQIPLSVRYDQILSDAPDAYQTLLTDVMGGDQTLFVRADEVEASWRLYEPILGRTDLTTYAPGTDGPEDAADMISTFPASWTPLGGPVPDSPG
jgi:glucose-6-phosphate 1-dehydrogenase